MPNTTTLKPFFERDFSLAPYISADFKSFSTKLRNFMKKVTEENPELELVSFNRGHFFCSGFFKSTETQVYIYFNVNWERGWHKKILYRTAKSDKDFTGGMNMYTTLEDFGKNVSTLAKRNYLIEGTVYSDIKLKKIGAEVASLWGAECYDFRVKFDESTVYFFCIEHGEEFTTSKYFFELNA